MATLIDRPPRLRSASGSPPALHRPRSSSLARRDSAFGYLFTAPVLIGFAVFVLGPLISAFVFSFQEYNTFSGQSTFVGTANYEQLASDGTLALVLRNTGVFALGVIPANIVLGIVLAVLMNQKLRGISIFRAAFFVPVVISLVAWSLVWDYLLQNNGGVNAILQMVGIQGPNWLADPAWAMTSIVLIQILKGAGVSMILFLAALQEVPVEITEAASVDGASKARVFFSITLPLISPTILLVSILATINALKAFAQVFLLTNGGPENATSILGLYIYQQAFQAFNVGYASTLAMVLFLVVLILTLLQWWSRKRWIHNES
jgi:multiple sugar transport system permease protein